MASEMTSSDSATEPKTVAVEFGSSSVLEDDLSLSSIELAGSQELGARSTPYSLGEAPVSETNAPMAPSSDSAAKRAPQEFPESESFCGVLISDEGGRSSDFLTLSGPDGKAVSGEVRKIDDCDGVETLLEAKKKRLLDELEGASIFQDVGPSEHPVKSTPIMEKFPDVGIKNIVNGVGEYLRSSLKIEVIDDTAVIEPITGPVIMKARENYSKEELEGKKTRRTRRKGKGKKADSEKAGSSTQVVRKSGDGTKRMYSREEMEALRFVGVVDQRKLWQCIYHGLGPVVMKEYMSLASSKHHQQENFSFSEVSQPFRRSRIPDVLGTVAGTRRANPPNVIDLPNLLRTLRSPN